MRGSTWAKWDLHVHTPDSLVQLYRDADPWGRFIDELESLPPEFKVIGINDYWFLDGYRRVVAEKASGRLANLSCILPVIELRLDRFAGTQGHLNRVNLHVIFDPAIDADVIQGHFIDALVHSLQVAPGVNGVWNAVVTRRSLEDLGKSLIHNAPEDKRKDYSSPLKEGFNNLVIPLEEVLRALGGHYFRNGHVVAMGKAEWASIKWDDGSIAVKRDLVNRASILFTAYDDVSLWHEHRTKLSDSNIMSKLLDCSDAHTWSDSTDNNRIGNCATWIRSVPTFSGLLHAIEEFDSRVYVGRRPPELNERDSRLDKVIDSITVRSKAGAQPSPISYRVELNPRFSVVVGNKGQGKSALLDFIARGANSSRSAHFAFLNSKRFLRPRNDLARNLEVELRWASGLTRVVPVSNGHDPSAVEQVEYLPQSLIETVCSSEAYSDESLEFEKELRRVLFGHLSVEEREGATSFEHVLNARLAALDPSLEARRSEIQRLSGEYERLVVESGQFDENELSGREQQLLGFLEAAHRDRAEAQTALEGLSAEADPAVVSLRAALAEAQVSSSETTARLNAAREETASTRSSLREIEGLLTRISVIEDDAMEISADLQRALGFLGEGRPPLVQVTLERAPIDVAREGWRSRIAHLEEETTRLQEEAAENEDLVQGMVEQLRARDGDREERRARLASIDERIEALKGDATNDQSLAGVRGKLDRVRALPHLIEQRRDEIAECAGSVWELLIDRLQVMKELYSPAAQFVSGSRLAEGAGIDFAATLAVSDAWDRLAESLDGRKNSALLSYLDEERALLDEPRREQVTALVSGVLSRISREGGDINGSNRRHPTDGLRKSARLSELVNGLASLRWLEARLGLTCRGEPLERLSPGQRGLVLLLFYLLVDNSRRPLLLDQPEENLDNAAVKNLLVPAIAEACTRRQIVLVTHNANLAVVGDADQILHTTVDDKGVFHVEGGALPDPATGEASIDILEGARPAFENRRDKYDHVIRPI